MRGAGEGGGLYLRINGAQDSIIDGNTISLAHVNATHNTGSIGEEGWYPVASHVFTIGIGYPKLEAGR